MTGINITATVGLTLLSLMVAGTASAAAATTPIAVELYIESTKNDGESFAALVTVRNLGLSPVTIPTPTPLQNVHVSVRAMQVAPHPCVAMRTLTPGPDGSSPITLEPGQEVEVRANVLAQHPLGLRPGAYEAVAVFVSRINGSAGSVASSPMRFVIVEPGGEHLEVYRRFLSACEPLGARSPLAADAALGFAQSNPDFPFASALLEWAREQSSAETRVAINNTLMSRFPNSQEAATAARDNERLLRHSKDLQAYEAYLADLGKALEDPTQKAAATAFRSLPMVEGPETYERSRQFLRHYPDSFFAPEVIHRIIVALESGRLPEPVAPSRSTLYRELLTRDRKNYWVDQAARQIRDGVIRLEKE